MFDLIVAALGGAVVSALLVYRWAHSDGHDDGYQAGHADGAREGSGVRNPALTGGPMDGGGSPDAAGGPGPVPR